METDQGRPSESGGGVYTAGQAGLRGDPRSPTTGDVHGNSNVEFDGTQLRGMLWHESGLIPSWDIEEWGWCNEGMSDYYGAP